METGQESREGGGEGLAAGEAMAEVGREVALQVEGTMEATGTMLVGTEEQAGVGALESLPIEGGGM
ncbi:hypothetical protein, partial [Thermus scotoductus]|uniref:hypothetical protein n=1 Tax=Thermus scotoductus TaxID=37636 RepID=UPI001C12B1F1